MNIKSLKGKLWLFSLVSFLLSSLIILFIPLSSFEGSIKQKAFTYFLSSVFWLGLISGCVFLALVNQKRKKEHKSSGLPFLTFFSNKIALIFDIALIISLIGIITVLFKPDMNQWISVIIIFTFVFSLEMHGMFNGKNFKYILNNSKQSGGKSK